MFKELMPVLRRRPLTLTVSSLDGGLVRVNVVPHGLDEDKKGNESNSYKDKVAQIPSEAIKALTRPLCLTGTPEEMDSGLARSLADFSESHVQLQEAFDQASKEIAEAVKAIKEREERERKERQKAKSKDSAPVKASVETSAGTESSDQKKDDEAPPKEPLPKNLGLF